MEPTALELADDIWDLLSFIERLLDAPHMQDEGVFDQSAGERLFLLGLFGGEVERALKHLRCFARTNKKRDREWSEMLEAARKKHPEIETEIE